MRTSNKQRFDFKVASDGQYLAIWSLEIPDADPLWVDYMVCLYSLNGGPALALKKYREDVTHELIVCSMDPEVRIDFDKSVFDQGHLQPLTPPTHAFQFKAESDGAARSRVQVCVNSLMAGTLKPEVNGAREWDMLFADSVILGRTP